MSDDIKARLREAVTRWGDEARLDRDALARIEALEAENATLRESLRAINNMGQSSVPDHFEFRSKARLIARAALQADSTEAEM